MKRFITWKMIDEEGVKAFEISEEGSIRNIHSKRYKSIGENHKGETIVVLPCHGVSKKFKVDDIMLKMFGLREDHSAKESTCFNHSEAMSENEEDYGLGAYSSYWRELKAEIEGIKEQQVRQGIDIMPEN